ncbi:hypothetical protein WMY93_020359 [Mugilogobius chulae]|uniref:G-protein coupled receptors family 1 profile domain-containing protein n=1 Tax=Mugilogobius chulae TaxID=88201 RepID=A0AAW0NH31_9GOBI
MERGPSVKALRQRDKEGVVFMMNLAVADLLQVLSLPLRIYYYLNNTWPFGHYLCMICFYLKYVNMYASIFFLVCVSVRRCELIMRPLRYNSSHRKWDLLICVFGWLFVCLACLLFPLLRSPNSDNKHASITFDRGSSSCFAELPMRDLSPPLLWHYSSSQNFLESAKSSVGPNPRSRRKTQSSEDGAKLRRDFVLLSHPITLCLASINCSLDPLMYYFMTDEFRRRLSKHEIPDVRRRLSCLTADDVQTSNSTTEIS